MGVGRVEASPGSGTADRASDGKGPGAPPACVRGIVENRRPRGSVPGVRLERSPEYCPGRRGMDSRKDRRSGRRTLDRIIKERGQGDAAAGGGRIGAGG